MLKNLINLFLIFLFSIIFSTNFSIAKSNNDQVQKSKNHPLKKLLIEKKAFDEICGSISQVVANWPKCIDCPDAKQAVIKLKNVKNKLEKTNNNLLTLIQ